jgi:hypothetical protein
MKSGISPWLTLTKSSICLTATVVRGEPYLAWKMRFEVHARLCVLIDSTDVLRKDQLLLISLVPLNQ